MVRTLTQQVLYVPEGYPEADIDRSDPRIGAVRTDATLSSPELRSEVVAELDERLFKEPDPARVATALDDFEAAFNGIPDLAAAAEALRELIVELTTLEEPANG